jgi:hypothetical protein
MTTNNFKIEIPPRLLANLLARRTIATLEDLHANEDADEWADELVAIVDAYHTLFRTSRPLPGPPTTAADNEYREADVAWGIVRVVFGVWPEKPIDRDSDGTLNWLKGELDWVDATKELYRRVVKLADTVKGTNEAPLKSSRTEMATTDDDGAQRRLVYWDRIWDEVVRAVLAASPKAESGAPIVDTETAIDALIDCAAMFALGMPETDREVLVEEIGDMFAKAIEENREVGHEVRIVIVGDESEMTN